MAPGLILQDIPTQLSVLELKGVFELNGQGVIPLSSDDVQVPVADVDALPSCP